MRPVKKASSVLREGNEVQKYRVHPFKKGRDKLSGESTDVNPRYSVYQRSAYYLRGRGQLSVRRNIDALKNLDIAAPY